MKLFLPFRRARFAFACVVLWLLFAGKNVPAATLVGHQAPPVAGVDLSGHRIRLSDERGKVVLLNFWATWCGPCRLEMPRFVEWQKQYSASGLQVIGISIDDPGAPVRAFAQKLHLNYPVIVADAGLVRTYGILGVPVTYLIDRNGIIRARFDGDSHLPAIEQEIRRLTAATGHLTPVAQQEH